MHIAVHVLKEIVFFFNEIAIYLLFGFIVAGVLHVLFPESIIRRHFGHNSLLSVIKSTLFGIPLPLCSCGVVPMAASLKNSGASRGATVSFLIATPQVGADSFMITYSLMGWVFALFRIVASLVTALAAGIVVNIIGRKDAEHQADLVSCVNGSDSFAGRLRSIVGYVEYDLLGSIANALLAGLIIAGAITAFIPDGLFERYLGNNFLSMVLMLVVGIPLYVCATASTPIAASLVMKGISPGAALVFLLTGPATNAITIATVLKVLGRTSTAVYLAAIAIVSLALGYLLNVITGYFGFQNVMMIHDHEMIPQWLKIGGSVVLAFMIGWYYLKVKILDRSRKETAVEGKTVSLPVQGMTCMHCAGTVKKAVQSVTGTSDVNVLLDDSTVTFGIEDADDIAKVKEAIRHAGYGV